MVVTFKHIGIAVEHLEDTVNRYKAMTGIKDVSLEEYERDGLHYNIAIVDLGGIPLELIQPLTKKGMAQEHLDHFGPGVYHFAVEVSDLDESLSVIHKRGIKTNTIRKGVHGEQICFLKQEILPGIFLELIEKSKG